MQPPSHTRPIIGLPFLYLGISPRRPSIQAIVRPIKSDKVSGKHSLRTTVLIEFAHPLIAGCSSNSPAPVAGRPELQVYTVATFGSVSTTSTCTLFLEAQGYRTYVGCLTDPRKYYLGSRRPKKCFVFVPLEPRHDAPGLSTKPNTLTSVELNRETKQILQTVP